VLQPAREDETSSAELRDRVGAFVKFDRPETGDPVEMGVLAFLADHQRRPRQQELPRLLTVLRAVPLDERAIVEGFNRPFDRRS